MIAPVDMVMLGSAATATSCCVAPSARASHRARVLAIGMLIAMAAVTMVASTTLQYAGAAMLLVSAVVLVTGGETQNGRLADWHRASGAALMAVAVLLHQHVRSLPQDDHTSSDMDMSAMSHSVGSAGHGAFLALMHAATAAYLLWTAVAVIRLRRRHITDPLRWEHLAMAASLAVMVFAM